MKDTDFEDNINSAILFCVESGFLIGRFKMCCRNYTGTVNCVLCREVYYTVLCPLHGRVHYRRFHCTTHVQLAYPSQSMAQGKCTCVPA